MQVDTNEFVGAMAQLLEDTEPAALDDVIQSMIHREVRAGGRRSPRGGVGPGGVGGCQRP